MHSGNYQWLAICFCAAILWCVLYSSAVIGQTWLVTDSQSYLAVAEWLFSEFKSSASATDLATRPWMISVLLFTEQYSAFGRVVQFVLWLAAALFIRLIFLELGCIGKKASMLALAYLAMLGPLAISNVLLSESWCIFFMLACLYFYLRQSYVVSACFAACAALSRPNLTIMWLMLLVLIFISARLRFALRSAAVSALLILSQSVVSYICFRDANWPLLSSRIHSYKYLFAFFDHIQHGAMFPQVLQQRAVMLTENLHLSNLKPFYQLYLQDLSGFSLFTILHGVGRVLQHNFVQGSLFINRQNYLGQICYGISLLENFICCLSSIFLAFYVPIKFRSATIALRNFAAFVSTLSLILLATSSVSFFQGDRLTLLVQPLVIIVYGLVFSELQNPNLQKRI